MAPKHMTIQHDSQHVIRDSDDEKVVGVSNLIRNLQSHAYCEPTRKFPANSQTWVSYLQGIVPTPRPNWTPS